MDDLVKYLENQKPGEIVDTRNLESLLRVYWEELDCSSENGMTGNKLLERMVDVFWEPPILTFSIERHGGYKQGSTRAEIQTWEVNINQKSAKCIKLGHKQLKPVQQRLDIKGLAGEIADFIINKEKDERLEWISEASVRVLIGKIIPPDLSFKPTLAGRRIRFRQELKKLLENQGWKEGRPYLLKKVN